MSKMRSKVKFGEDSITVTNLNPGNPTDACEGNLTDFKGRMADAGIPIEEEDSLDCSTQASATTATTPQSKAVKPNRQALSSTDQQATVNVEGG